MPCGPTSSCPGDRSFGNGRYARQVLDEAVTRQAGRLRGLADPPVEDLRALLPADIAAAPAKAGQAAAVTARSTVDISDLSEAEAARTRT